MKCKFLFGMLVALLLVATASIGQAAEEKVDDKAAAKVEDKKAAAKNAEDEKDDAADAQGKAEKKRAAAAENPKRQQVDQPPRVRARVPKHRAAPNPQVQRAGLPLLNDPQRFAPGAQRRNAPPAQAQPQQPRRQPRPALSSPWQGGLSPAAQYRLQSMGRHVHLTPAMRWQLSRSQPANASQTTQQGTARSTVPGQGASTFYPGVSRMPQQKPFADLQRPPSGPASYWPLLLEGREDPNTGLIIWSLP